MSVATNEYWVEQISEGCKHLWTDFGAPMCNIRGQCFIGAPDVLKCPIGKIIIQEKSDED